jgi:hypothetical protein
MASHIRQHSRLISQHKPAIGKKHRQAKQPGE